jgi:hypothetical protein
MAAKAARTPSLLPARMAVVGFAHRFRPTYAGARGTRVEVYSPRTVLKDDAPLRDSSPAGREQRRRPAERG